MIANAAGQAALARVPTQDTEQLEKNRIAVAKWFKPHKNLPWLYELRRRPNYAACKSCFYYKAGINDALTKGEFKLVHDGRLRKDALGRHASQKSHQHSWRSFTDAFGAGAALPGDREPTGRPVIGAVPPLATPRMNEIVVVTPVREIYRSIFRVAFNIVLTYGAANSFTTWLECSELNGTTLGNSHRSKVTFNGIIESIANLLRTEQIDRLIEAKFFSYLGDGSEQGRGQAEAEAQAVQYWKRATNGRRELTCEYFDLSLVDRADSADGTKHDAPAITACYTKTLDSRFEQHTAGSANVWRSMLVLMGLDGASVNMGAYTGIAALFKAILPWVLARHCGAHNLELAAVQSKSDSPELIYLEDGLKSLYSRYVTAKQWGSLKDSAQMAEALDAECTTHRFVSLHGIRWLASQKRTIKAALENWTAAAIDLH